ncbi:hypothetical protein NLI96_g4150 [Meripilus lineatus]|uniref:triacylglycerol lipase n=1 Tax=Meripilus lineatus TaxID=2056292 RepID=A0AAD5YKC8_9APHY|nr:hypothetical protein NLI96_g4150 [Physisporinus lineatus]
MGADSAANTPNQRHSCLSLDKCSPDPNFSSATTAMLFNLLPASLQYLFASFILSDAPTRPSPTLSFTLRHEFGLINGTRTVFTNLDSTSHLTDSEFSIQTMNTKTYRPHSQEAFSYARFSGLHAQQELPWDGLDILGPNVEERETLYLLAKMANNAYALPGDKEWYDIGEEWNSSYPFGWEPDADGLRGHVFSTEDNSTVVISIKGTSPAWPAGGGGPTVVKDKLNDNLLFSCCCARVGPTWRPVCSCYEGGYKCDQDCLEQSLTQESLFYQTGINLYNNVSYMFPNANIWLTGHSLGGGLASLIGITFGAPVVAFEAPAERMAARRLHLPSPPSVQHVTHVYHTADPIPMGVCTGVSSSCAIGGYALESRCHLGNVLKYDTVSKWGWSVDVRNHGITVIVDKLLSADWEEEDEGSGDNGADRKRNVPKMTDEGDCVDCFNWEYGNYRNLSTFGCGH